MKISNNLHRVGSDLVSCYLVTDPDGITLIDAGIPGLWSDLEDELATIGRSIGDIRGVVLTHGDSDHIGFAERLRTEHGVPVHIHEADVERARLEVKKPNSGWGPIKAGPLLGFLWYSARKGGLRMKPVTEMQTFTDGAVLDLPGAPRIVHLPGHTPGSVAVHLPGADAVCVGDALTTRNVLTGATGPKPAPFTLDPAQAVSSLDRLGALDATWVLPGHGPAYDGGAPEATRLVKEAAAL